MKISNLLGKILDISPDSFGVFDDKNRLVFCNNQFADMFGISKESAIGMNHAELLRCAYESKSGVHIETDDIESWIEDSHSRLRQQQYRYFETDFVDGRWTKISQLVLDNNYLVVIGTDITDLKQTKNELQIALTKVKKLAGTDDLTGVKNRRAFIERANEEIHRSLRYGHELALILIDLDYFKSINDSYGHGVGDQVLKYFASHYDAGLREEDTFARIGGEEFVALLPETTVQNALVMANRLRQQVSQLLIPQLDTEQHIQITCSSGLSSLEGKHDSIEGMLARADTALYQSKQTGRNCCTISKE